MPPSHIGVAVFIIAASAAPSDFVAAAAVLEAEKKGTSLPDRQNQMTMAFEAVHAAIYTLIQFTPNRRRRAMFTEERIEAEKDAQRLMDFPDRNNPIVVMNQIVGMLTIALANATILSKKGVGGIMRLWNDEDGCTDDTNNAMGRLQWALAQAKEIDVSEWCNPSRMNREVMPFVYSLTQMWKPVDDLRESMAKVVKATFCDFRQAVEDAICTKAAPESSP